MSSTDPYKPPGSDLEEKARENFELELQQPRKVSVMRGLQWYKEGFACFAKSPGTWLLITIIFVVLLVLVSLIPMPSQQFTLGNILDTFFLAGLMTGLYAIDKNGRFGVEYLFAAFKHPMRLQLLIVGIISLVIYGMVSYILLHDATLAFQDAMQPSGGGHQNNASMEETMQAAKTFYVAVFKTSLYTIPIMMLFWFTAPLIILHRVPAVAAMKLSFLGCFYNTPAFLVFILVGGLLGIFATLLLGLGWFVLIPVIVAAQYIAWRDIFTTYKSSST
jgi:uncharacterized membrane protein